MGEQEDLSEVRGWFDRDELPPIAWQSSRFSASGGADSVEAGPLRDGTGRVAVRHSGLPDSQVVVYTRAEWDAFIGGAKDGEFDF